MKMLRTSLVVLACAAAPLAFAQWQWIDKTGRKVYSDQSPPPDIPADKILKRPNNAAGQSQAAAPAAAPAPAPAPAAPKVSGKDKELEEKKKQQVAAEEAKKKAQEEEIAKARGESCDRAKRGKATFESGVRIANTNDKGEREFLDDNARAAELKRIEGIIARDCKS